MLGRTVRLLRFALLQTETARSLLVSQLIGTSPMQPLLSALAGRSHASLTAIGFLLPLLLLMAAVSTAGWHSLGCRDPVGAQGLGLLGSPSVDPTADQLVGCFNASLIVGVGQVSAEQEGLRRASTVEKQFAAETLAFVTPWNPDGYDLAARFAKKLDWVSPVGLRFENGLLQGMDVMHYDHFRRWKEQHPTMKVVPRVQMNGVVDPDVIITNIKGLKLFRAGLIDGLVIEFGYIRMSADVLPILKSCLARLRKALGPGRSLVFVLPAPQVAVYLPQQIAAELGPLVDRFILMMYDAHGNAPPCAPLAWVRDGIRSFVSREKLLIGINWYGRTSNGDAISGETLLRHLRLLEHEQGSGQLWQWSPPPVAEHSISVASEHGEQTVLSFPTPYSLSLRMAAATQDGCAGIAIWEIGQGVPRFFDLL